MYITIIQIHKINVSLCTGGQAMEPYYAYCPASFSYSHIFHGCFAGLFI